MPRSRAGKRRSSSAWHKGPGVEAFSETLTPVLGPLEMVWPGMAAFARISLIFLLMPVFGERAVPARARLGVAWLVTLMVWPLVEPVPAPAEPSDAAALLVTEAAIGFAIGLSLRLGVLVLQMLGTLLSQSLSLSQPLGEGIATEPNTTISTLLTLAGLTLLVSADLHITMIAWIAESFTLHPHGLAPDTGLAAERLTNVVGQAWRTSLALAVPFLILNFSYNLILGFLNRAMPQLLVSFVGLPGITLAGLFLLVISAGGMLVLWLEGFAPIVRAGWI